MGGLRHELTLADLEADSPPADVQELKYYCEVLVLWSAWLG